MLSIITGEKFDTFAHSFIIKSAIQMKRISFTKMPFISHHIKGIHLSK